MSPYVTIFGKKIRIITKPLVIQKIATRLIEMHRLKGIKPKLFAIQARQIIKDEYPTDRLYYRAMRGTLGEVFRDCYYRLHLSRFDAKQSDYIKQQLCFNPLRLLLDRYLDNDQTQKDFAVKIGVNPAQLSRSFNLLLKGNREYKTGEISIKLLTSALKTLGVVPRIAR